MRRFACLLPLAVVVACTTAPQAAPHKVVVFFQEWSAAIDPAAGAAITAAAQWGKEYPGTVLRVTGYADPTGSAQANDYLSLTRAQVVADQLMADGIERGRIVLAAHGATDFTLTSQESRRVEIAIGAP
jgi:OOP family OmpA-OmpF porin